MQRTRTFLLACMMGAAALCAHAEDAPSSSLFFTGDDVKHIEALAAQSSAAHQQPEDIHLGAVLYYGPDKYTVWLQGRRWNPQTVSDDIKITDVQPGLVRIHLAQNMEYFSHEIVLKPHQTYQAATGRIIEGAP